MILACYSDSQRRMIVPGDLQATASGVTTSYVIAHEYGHHVASHRSNAPLSAPDYGPKRWASYELVCLKTDQRLLFPGNESVLYHQNPGENWAETYAQARVPAAAVDLLEPADARCGRARRGARGRPSAVDDERDPPVQRNLHRRRPEDPQLQAAADARWPAEVHAVGAEGLEQRPARRVARQGAGADPGGRKLRPPELRDRVPAAPDRGPDADRSAALRRHRPLHAHRTLRGLSRRPALDPREDLA